MPFKRLINQLLARTDAPEADDLALVCTLKGNGPDPSVIDVVITDGIAGVADPGNSSTTPLGNGAVFTGQQFDTLNYPSFSISCRADVLSSPLGLTLIWSHTAGVSTEAIRETYPISGNVSSGGDLVPFVINGNHRARYFQVEYTNFSVPQTAFALSVIHRPVPVEDQLRAIGDWNNSFIFNVSNMGIGENRVGTVFDAKDMASVELNISVNLASAAGGLILQWSYDGKTWTAGNQITLTLAASAKLNLEVPHLARFFRISYTNGAAASFVSFQVLHHKVATPNCKPGGWSPSVTRVGINVASTLLLAANPKRLSALIANYSPAATTLYVKLGSGANIGAGTESFTAIILANGHFRLEIDEYYGDVYGISSGADAAGAWLVTETRRGE